MIKSGRMGCNGHVESMRDSRNANKVLMDTPGRKRHLEDLGLPLGILLKCTLNMMGVVRAPD